MPDLLHDLARFPSIDSADAGINVLREQRFRLRTQAPTPLRDLQLEANGHALECWEALYTALGGARHARSDGGDDHGVAAERLRKLLGEVDWQAGKMP